MLRNMNSRFAFYPSRFVCVLQLNSVFPCVTIFCEARKSRARKSFSGRTSMRRRSFRPRNPACCQSRVRNRRRETRRASSRGRETVSAASVGLENARARCPGRLPEGAAKAWAKPKARRHPRATSRGIVHERFPGPRPLIESNCKSLANSF